MADRAIPEVLRLEAVTAGLDEVSIARRWAKYVAWHYGRYPEQDYRLVDWRRQIDWELEDIRKRLPRPLDAQELQTLSKRADREREERAKDEEYKRQAIPLREWLDVRATEEQRAAAVTLMAWMGRDNG